MQYPTVGYAPISLARVAPFVGFPFVYTTAYQIADARFDAFPRFPYTHADATPQPFVDVADLAAHVGKVVIFRPSPQVFPQGGFAPGIPQPIAS